MPIEGKAALVGVALVAAACGPADRVDSGLGEPELRAVREVEAEYTAAWEANDPEAVMATLAPGAVIIPGGMAPIRGDSAVRAFWWPAEGPVTTVTSYESDVEEVGGSGDAGFLRGTGTVAFEWEEDGERRAASSTSAWLALVRRQPDGTWRMTHRMWHRIESP